MQILDRDSEISGRNASPPPGEMRALRAWLVWKYVPNPPKKPRKVPYYASGLPRSGTQGSPEDRAAMVSFDEALHAARVGGYDGVGFAMHADFNLVALDFDNCVVDRAIDPRVAALVAGTYSEISPSGTGVRAFVRGSLQSAKDVDAERGPFAVEYFGHNGFVTFTGDVTDECSMFGCEDTLRELTLEVVADYTMRFGSLAAAPSAFNDAAGLMALSPVLDLSGTDIAGHLNNLPRDLDYDTWVRVGMAVHHETHGTGFDLWHAWSKASPKYTTERYCAERWHSFGKFPGAPTTMAWVIKRANEYRASADYHKLMADIATKPKDAVMSTWAVRAATLPKDRQGAVIDEMERQHRIGRRVLNAALKDATTATRRDEKSSRVQRKADGRQVIIVAPEDSAKQAALVGQLIAQNRPTTDLVQFASRPSRIVDLDPPFAHAQDDEDARPPKQVLIEMHTMTSMRALVEGVAVFAVEGENGPSAIQVPPPVVDNLVQLRETTDAPRVVGLLAHPIVTPRGEVLAANGLHRGTGLFLHGLADGTLRPYSRPEAQAALPRLRSVFLEGFEFASEVDEAVALVSLFAAVERRLMDSAPGLAVIAASQSSGKTTLALRLHAILTGRPMPTWTLPVGDDSEIEKRLLGILLASPEMVCFDNVPDGLTVHCGPALNSAMTSPIFECRMLGANRNQQAPTNVFWVITGNNLRLGADETTRLLQTRLAPSAHRPETRTFKHPDVLQHALSIRSEVLQHVIGIVAGYLQTVERASGGTRFPQWDRLARQPLLWAGGCDPLRALDTNYEQAEHLQSLRVLLRELHTLFEGETFAARDVVNDAPISARDALEGLQCRNVTSVRSVGRALAAVVGRVSSDGGESLYLTSSLDRNGVTAFRVMREVDLAGFAGF
ncbi:hypothetical protein J2W24_002907 [Variovorax boronicumulans]|uniref:PriCT-2 domain-containing protein n=1 Tax=Variovorax boronicumulans TaxID=436515 RepID=UPI002789C8C9|nr:PriCT-2 domain-containing protein [Variovorax boronicumulans]MDP9917256.1 hypothetical protein [Variovorax boronicumulans]